MAISELRFPSPGLKFYVQGVGVSAFGIAFIAWGVLIVAFDPWNWAGVIFLLGGVFVGVLGVVLTLLVWFIYVWGTTTAWRRWRQFRPPAVTIDAAGVGYLTRRGHVLIPWPDIEQVHLGRTILRKSVVTKVSLRLTPAASRVRDGVIRLPANPYLNVGLLSELAVPEDIAVGFLQETAGSRLEVTEVDRRAPVPD